VAKRSLGGSGIQVEPFALGGNVFGWTINESESFQVLDGFLAGGMELIDTADVYSTWRPGNKGGESETILGNWMSRRKNRDQLILATKVGKPMGEHKKGLSPRYIREAVEASLQRLKTEYIDLYQSHEDDPATPLEDTLGAFTDLIREGKIRAIGASNYTAERLAKALAVSKEQGLARFETLQPPYNLYDRDFEKKLQPLCVEQGIGVISYYSLASGFLTGKYRSAADQSKSVRGRGAGKYLDDRGKKILKALDLVAGKYSTVPATVALAWLMTRPAVTAPIASATTPAQLKALLEAVNLSLDTESLRLLTDLNIH
jgi:aryl-alcohol dehydrogenase-like predicted oxidoreductase